jgi:hypothetical protein
MLPNPSSARADVLGRRPRLSVGGASAPASGSASTEPTQRQRPNSLRCIPCLTARTRSECTNAPSPVAASSAVARDCHGTKLRNQVRARRACGGKENVLHVKADVASAGCRRRRL